MDVDDSDSEDERLLPQSFCVDLDAVKNFTIGEIPSNGHEYLMNVMHESKNCPTLIANREDFSDDDKGSLTNTNVQLPKVPGHLIASDEWKDQQLNNFIKLRKTIAKIRVQLAKSQQPGARVKRSSKDWWRYIYGEDGQMIAQPLASLVCPLNQMTLIKLIECHMMWFESGKLEMSVDAGLWLFSLFACLETPLDRDTCFLLRTLVRLARQERMTVDDPNGKDTMRLQSLNLIICLVSMFFGQADLAD